MKSCFDLNFSTYKSIRFSREGRKTGLTAFENPSFSDEKTDWMDANWEQGGALQGLWLRMGFL